MIDWAGTALKHLPQFNAVIQKSVSSVDLWWNFKEILADAGVDEARHKDVRAIYDYAWWCFAVSGDPDLSAEAEAYFYEDLPAYSDFEDQVPQFISPSQFQSLEEAFRYRLSEEEFEEFRRHYFEARCQSD